MLMKILKGYALLFLLLVSIWLFAAPDNARQFCMSLVGGAIAGWVVSQKRCITSEGFRLVDHYGNLRAELGLRVPAQAQDGGLWAGWRQGLSGRELDTPPALDLYRKDGEKAVTLALDSGREGTVSLALFGPGGHARVALVIHPGQQDQARRPLHQRADGRPIAGPLEEVAFPVARHRAGGHVGRALGNRRHVGELAPSVGPPRSRPARLVPAATRSAVRSAACRVAAHTGPYGWSLPRLFPHVVRIRR